MTEGHSMRNWAIALIVIGALAGLGVGLQYQQSNADLTDAEVFRIIKDWHDENGHLFASQDELKMALEQIDMEHDHKGLYAEHGATVLALNSIRADIAQLKIDVSRIDREIDRDITTPRDTDFNLETCMDYDCRDESTIFNPGDVVYVSGDNPTSDRELFYKVYDTNGVKLADRKSSTLPNGPFIVAYTLPSNAPDGTYRVVVEIDNDTDEIDFRVS